MNQDRPQLNQKQLVDRYGDKDKGGSITLQDPKWWQLNDALRWTNTMPARVTERNAEAFHAKVETLLFIHGYMLLIDNHTSGVSHMMVVFGTRALPSFGLVLRVMNPTTGQLEFFRVSDLFDHSVAIFGAKEGLADPSKHKPPMQFIDPEKS